MEYYIGSDSTYNRDHVRNYIHTVTLSQRWYCRLTRESENMSLKKEETSIIEELVLGK